MKVTSVIVTYNRKDCLKKLLDIYKNLSVKPDNIIIVNNNSNDGTKELLNEWVEIKEDYFKYLINTEQNIGGSGGFYLGIKKALEIDSDWIYISDDDAYPKKDTFEILNNFIYNNNIESIAAICGKVINNGKIDLEHRRRINKKRFFIKEVVVNEEEYNNNFELDLFSYVGTMLNANYLRRYGITEKDYFIYYDDTEHSLRLSKVGRIICIPEVEIVHDLIPADNKNNISWKSYYGQRNRLLMIKKHYGKKYFIIEYILDKLRVIKRIILNDLEGAKILNKGINDAKNNIKGLDDIYKPGWKLIK